MGFRDFLGNIRALFRWTAEVYHIWFTPYHSDEEEDAEGGAKPAEADTAPDRSPKPSPPPEEPAYSPYSGEPAPEASAAVAESEPPPETAAPHAIAQAMAYRGVMSKKALADLLHESPDQISYEVQRLVETGVVETLDHDRYLLVSQERRRILRGDKAFLEWLARLGEPQLESEVLDVLDELFRQLSMKITVGKNVAVHVRQKLWMLWHSQPDACRVRMFCTPTEEQWSSIRGVDDEAKRYREHGRRGRSGRDSVVFRWRATGDVYGIESVLLDAGREFQRQARRRRPKRDRFKAPPPPESPETEAPSQESGL